MKVFSRLLRIFASRAALVRCDIERWNELFDELARRGQGRRESGAFLLARKDGQPRVVVEVVYFDDLDPLALNGGIHLRSYAFSRLWRICRDRRLTVIADIHTHPGDRVAQSGTDAENPLIARSGHIALIAPQLAQRSRATEGIGVHIYQGDQGWESHLGTAAARRLYVGRFA